MSQALEFVGRLLSAKLNGMQHDGVVRHGGPFRPKLATRVKGKVNPYARCIKFPFQDAYAVYGIHPSVHTHSASLWQRTAKPLGNGGRTLHAVLHEAERSTLQLLLCGDEVAAVRPQSGIVSGHHCSTCTAVESAYPLPCLPMCRNVLPAMRVGAWEYERRQALFPKESPKALYSGHSILLVLR